MFSETEALPVTHHSAKMVEAQAAWLEALVKVMQLINATTSRTITTEIIVYLCYNKTEIERYRKKENRNDQHPAIARPCHH
jgi:hypothetical protein